MARSRLPRGTRIQSLVFDKREHTPREARSWASEHGFKVPASEQTKNEIRLRQEPPGRFLKQTYRRITLDDGVDAVIAVPRKSEESVAKKSKKSKKSKKLTVKRVRKAVMNPKKAPLGDPLGNLLKKW
jgi:hypothetical protein